MSIITLLTDFGICDEYVGTMKGVILSIDPSATIIDITHHIEPQDIVQAAYAIQSYYRYFPEGTVHVVVVDPDVGGERAILALETGRYIFLAPDNGVLSLLMDEADVKSVICVDNSAYFLKEISRTFHGRDIFSPIAAHIIKGVKLQNLGSVMDQNDIKQLNVQKPYVADNGDLVGCILSIDRFGNLITDIGYNRIKRFCRLHRQKNPEVKIGSTKITGLSENYESKKAKTPLALIGSRGYLEIAVGNDSAKLYFSAKKGDPIRLIC
ncbi:MAG: SAM-dependent chlorinase/fluorinase [Desulfobacterales bacterium]|jgi:hypothetical protein|nr:SAM-dependent chlorinase/fluorinase [Desulfobacterales bacterium]|tara:strand:- start:85 stop:885 length:801 start_codon:yes stop_codon:yes gene_type:complete